MPTMRAKMEVESVTSNLYSETLKFRAVCGKSPEDNTFAAATPSGELTMMVSNENLRDKIKPGQKFYLDFTEAE